nr:hypothetical protein [Haloferax marinum]
MNHPSDVNSSVRDQSDTSESPGERRYKWSQMSLDELVDVY